MQPSTEQSPAAAAAHLGYPLDTIVLFRPLGGDGLRQVSLREVLESLPPADIARCLSQHPSEAIEFVGCRLHLQGELVCPAKDIDRSAKLAALVDDAGPYESLDAVAAHVLSRNGRGTLPALPGAVNTRPDSLSEAPRTAHDGMIWPRRRDQMRSPTYIRQLMALDMREILRERGDGLVMAADLRARGWTQAQIEAHCTPTQRVLARDIAQLRAGAPPVEAFDPFTPEQRAVAGVALASGSLALLLGLVGVARAVLGVS